MATFKNTFIFDSPAIGSPAASWGSNIFVVHNDASQADTKWNEPHFLVGAYTDGQGADGTNTQEIIVPSAGLSLELYATSDTAAARTLHLGVFGKVPTKDSLTGNNRKWPGDVDSTNYDNPTDMWIPLQNLEAVWVAKDGPAITTDQGGKVALQIDNTDMMKFDSTNEWYMGQRTSVYLAGCKSICVSVKVTDSIANGLVLGRFVG